MSGIGVQGERNPQLPDLSAEELDELVEKDLASYLDAAELPLTSEGGALGWVSVDVERVPSDERY